jgi:tetratricopeptide (TPR) repeat protein
MGNEYTKCLPLARQEAERALDAGQFARAARAQAVIVFCHVGLGEIEEGRAALQEAQALAARVGQPMFLVLNTQEALCGVLDEGWDDLAPIYAAISATVNPAYAWGLGLIYGNAARIAAYRNRAEEALGFLDRAVPWLERAPGWSTGFNSLACDAAEVLWRLESTRHIALIERSLREKVLAPDFRYATREARLALARLCALQGRHDDALGWFGKARQVLSEQGARPLLAIADFDEALMYLRRGGPGDAERAAPLLEAAQRQFEAIGMAGWIARAKALSKRPG